jgi:hypothetical protein
LLTPLLALACSLPAAGSAAAPGVASEPGVVDVWPGDEIQAALERAASDPALDRVQVHAGTYRPARPGQALLWFNARHDGLTVEAVGEVILTAANPEIADPQAASFPAVVNHVVYFGDGVSEKTVFRGFRITGANGFLSRDEGEHAVERQFDEPELRRDLFFYSDGGGIKIFGRSYPTLERLEIYDNYTSPCGGGVSIEHRGFNQRAVRIVDSIFRDNRTRITGSAVDLLPGSSAILDNCLFVGNLSNTGTDNLSPDGKAYLGESGSGALTVFKGSRAFVSRSTFTGNRNAVDDLNGRNIYLDSIFWHNDVAGGANPGARYELLLVDGSGVSGCFVGGRLEVESGTIDARRNELEAPDPDFDDAYRPRAAEYAGVGYRPPAERTGDGAEGGGAGEAEGGG